MLILDMIGLEYIKIYFLRKGYKNSSIEIIQNEEQVEYDCLMMVKKI